MIKKLIVLIILLMVKWFPTSAQTNDCGNGMAWQLNLGDAGKALVTSRIYATPDGDVVARLSEGEEFTVRDGPECTADGRSWWQIEMKDGTLGWIFEGADGTYRVEPVLDGEIEVECGAGSPLTVGKLATVLDADAILQFVQLSEEEALIENPVPLAIETGDELLIVEGPLCLNNNVLWRVRYPYLPEAEFPGVDTVTGDVPRVSPLWISEINNSEIVLALSENTYLFDSEYFIEPITLVKPSSAPIVSPTFQLGFAPGGGGSPIFTDSNFCYLYEGNSVAYYGELNCILQVFPQAVESVLVRIFQPDGTLFSEESYKLSQILGDRELTVLIPTDFDLPGGLWRVEFQTETESFAQIYVLDYRRNSLPVMVGACDESEPVLMLSGFAPNSIVPIYLAESFQDSAGDENFAESIFEWEIQTDEFGNAFAKLRLAIEAGNYIFASEANELVSTSFPWECYAGFGFDDAPMLDYGDWIIGALGEGGNYYYQFSGRLGEKITINLISASEENDPLLQLLNAQGEVISENDDAETPLYGAFDAAIENFSLPADGIYYISVSTINPTKNFDYTLILESN